MVNRRAFVTGLGTMFMVPVPIGAESNRVFRIAYVNETVETEEHKPQREAFRATMSNLGYVEGRNLIVDWRYAANNPERLRALVDEAVGSRPDVLLAFEVVAQLMRAKTVSIPIVLTGAFEPIGAGLAQSLAHPGLNVTGSTLLSDQLIAKHIEMLRQILPRLSRVGQLVDTGAPGCRLIENYASESARQLGVRFTPYPVANRGEVERAFLQMEKERPDAILPCPSNMLFSLREVLASNAIRLRLPYTSFVPTNLRLGVLFSYAATIEEGFRRAAMYVDKILKGAKPGDLPVEQPTKFELIINMKTAKALGLTIPQSLLLRADQVIE